MYWDGSKEQTRILEQNILNLSFAQFDGVGEFDMPEILPVDISEEELRDTPLQGFNFALQEKHPENIGCHFFLHDYQFERVWRYPDRYVDVLKKFKFVLSPQFSTYNDTPKIVQMWNVYRNRWCNRYWQENGIKVIPSIQWGSDYNFEWCLDGLPKHSVIAVSTTGDGRWGGYKSIKTFYDKTIDKLEPKFILLYGKDLSNSLNGNIVFKRLISSKVAI